MYAPPHQQPRLQRSLSQKKRDQAAARKEYNNEWQTGLCNAPCASPGYCCYALFCPNCAAYSQRVLQMGAAWPSQYTCCNGMTCISGKCGERSNPELCLACEVCCCFPNAVVTTRFMVQCKSNTATRTDPVEWCTRASCPLRLRQPCKLGCPRLASLRTFSSWAVNNNRRRRPPRWCT